VKLKHFILITVLISPSLQMKAQDTLTVMYYNVLSLTSDKSHYMKDITKFVNPDVIVLNEVSNDSSCVYLMDSVLNTDGVTHYQKADFTEGTDTDNMLFYNNEIVHLISQDTIQTDLRIINEYKLYYNNDTFTSQYDSVLFNCYAAHLKASTGSANEQQRLQEVQRLVTHLEEGSPKENILFGGDMNFYSSTEPALEYILSPGNYQLFDPIDSIADWHDNSLYAHVHTQSTRTTSFGGGASGGMDDRFDFIFASSDLMSGINYAKYIAGSYWAFGNDGHHLNDSLTALPQYNNLPDSVTQSLFYMSDHLPVVMKIIIRFDAKVPEFGSQQESEIKIYPNPSSDEVSIEFTKAITGKIKYKIETSDGRIEKSGTVFPDGDNTYKIKTDDLNEGFYIINMNINGRPVAAKVNIIR
jgi:hypothetical protein